MVDVSKGSKHPPIRVGTSSTQKQYEDTKVTKNLRKIKSVIEQPKETKPDIRFSKIKEHLGTKEYHHTVREERWHPTVYCPNCHSTNVKRLPIEHQKSPYIHRYLCLTCRSRFDDDSKTPFEFGIPPIETWIQCWFLTGCTNSLEYIAAKLNLDVETVRQMIEELRQIFRTNQPLTRLMSYEKWLEQHSATITERIKKGILTKKREDVLFKGESASQPDDTAELRKQKQRKNTGLSFKPKGKKF